MLKLLLLVVSATVIVAKVYEGFKVYDIDIKSNDELEFLRNLGETEGDKRSLDFLSFHNNVDDTVKLLVNPNEQNFVEDLFQKKKLDYRVAVDNAQE